MTAAHRRGARRERQAAELFGTRRVHRSRFQSAPDCEPVELPSGDTLILESKTRKSLPSWLLGALSQARSYCAGCVPVAILSATGGEPYAFLPARDLARLLGFRNQNARAREGVDDHE